VFGSEHASPHGKTCDQKVRKTQFLTDVGKVRFSVFWLEGRAKSKSESDMPVHELLFTQRRGSLCARGRKIIFLTLLHKFFILRPATA